MEKFLPGVVMNFLNEASSKGLSLASWTITRTDSIQTVSLEWKLSPDEEPRKQQPRENQKTRKQKSPSQKRRDRKRLQAWQTKQAEQHKKTKPRQENPGSKVDNKVRVRVPTPTPTVAATQVSLPKQTGPGTPLPTSVEVNTFNSSSMPEQRNNQPHSSTKRNKTYNMDTYKKESAPDNSKAVKSTENSVQNEIQAPQTPSRTLHEVLSQLQAQVQRNQIHQQFNDLRIYNGFPQDECDSWLKEYENFCECTGRTSPQDKADIMGRYVTGIAWDWFHRLPKGIQLNPDRLSQEFKAHFGYPDYRTHARTHYQPNPKWNYYYQ